jgi:ubiquinone biosynthesis monooxygenase Coq7
MIDPFIIGLDRALRTLFAAAPATRAVPGQELQGSALSAQDKVAAASLMRINHVGEVCAQALYQGQALTCRDPVVRQALAKASSEETDHLAWTERRIHELGGRKSVLNPLWYLGALSFGIVAGRLGDAWSLGFLAETERQVEAHLDRHLYALPMQDIKSRMIVQQMKLDEGSHAETAIRLGARDLPSGVKTAMRLAAGVMTGTAYYL